MQYRVVSCLFYISSVTGKVQLADSVRLVLTDNRVKVTPSRRLKAKGETFTISTGQDTNIMRKI